MLDDGTAAPVAVIDDDAAARSALGRLLHVAGFEPALFDSAESFIGAPASRAWLCLIVDVQLGGMSGIDLQHRLRAQGSDVPVIVITGNRTDRIRERAEENGCAAFLWKPFTGDAILTVLASLPNPPRT